MNFAKIYVPKMFDFEIVELFNFIKTKDLETSIHDEVLSFGSLEISFEKYFSSEDSVALFVNQKFQK